MPTESQPITKSHPDCSWCSKPVDGSSRSFLFNGLHFHHYCALIACPDKVDKIVRRRAPTDITSIPKQAPLTVRQRFGAWVRSVKRLLTRLTRG